jgi:hypothetical protein
MRHKYINTENFRAPYDASNLDLQGLGASNNGWPDVRSYVDVSQYRAPYRGGYFQDGTLTGLGADAAAALPAAPTTAIDVPVATGPQGIDKFAFLTEKTLGTTPRWVLMIGSMAVGFSLAALILPRK